MNNMSDDIKSSIQSGSQSDRSSSRRLDIILFFFKVLTGRSHIILYFIPLLLFFCLLYYYIRTRYLHLVPSLVQHLLPASFAFFVVVMITPMIMKIARRFKILDQPVYPKLHLLPTPLLGGVAVYIAFITVALIYGPLPKETLSIIIGATIILVLGTIDDIYPLSSAVRLLGQVAASLIVISSGLIVSFMPNTLWGNTLAVIFTLIWILGIVNATNFSDGADGLAMGFAVIASVFFFLITLHLEQFHITLLISILIGSGMGFLIFNFKPAKIYLGDGGSTFVGFLLACIALYGEWSSWGAIIALGIPVLILGVLIFDMIYITCSRIRNGNVRNIKEWLDYRARDHFHHRLINLGFREEEAVVFIYITCMILGLSALVIENARISYPVVILLIQAVLIFIHITILMLMGRRPE